MAKQKPDSTFQAVFFFPAVVPLGSSSIHSRDNPSSSSSGTRWQEMDGSDSCFPPHSSKENSAWVFLQGFPLLCALPILLSPEGASRLSKFLSPRPAKWNKNTSTGSFSATPTQPGRYPHCRTALQALQMKKQLESSWGRWA